MSLGLALLHDFGAVESASLHQVHLVSVFALGDDLVALVELALLHGVDDRALVFDVDRFKDEALFEQGLELVLQSLGLLFELFGRRARLHVGYFR